MSAVADTTSPSEFRFALQLFNLDTKTSFELPADDYVASNASQHPACSVVFQNQIVLLGSRDNPDQVSTFINNKVWLCNWFLLVLHFSLYKNRLSAKNGQVMARAVQT